MTNSALLVLFVTASLIILIHLLNMLIAQMGEIYTQNNETYSKVKIKEQLRFILDKWVFRKYVLGDA